MSKSSVYKSPGFPTSAKNKLDLLYTVDENGWMYVSNVWRIGISDDNLVIQKYDGTSWIDKGEFS